MNKSVLHVLDYVYYSFVVSVAVVGNSLVVISILKYYNLRNNTNYLIGSLAVCDFLMACTWPFLLGKSTFVGLFHTIIKMPGDN